MYKTLLMPIPAGADLFEIADVCAALVVEMIDSEDAAETLALCGRLSHALDALNKRCDAGLPPHLLERLTADELPAVCVPECWSDSDLMLGYAQGLTQALLSCTLPFTVTEQLTGLLHDVVLLLVEYLQQPYLKRGADHA